MFIKKDVRKNLNDKLFWIYTLILSAVVITISIGVYSYIVNITLKQTKIGMEQTSQRVSSELDMQLREMDKLVVQTMFNDTVQETMRRAQNYGGEEYVNYFDIFKDDAFRMRSNLMSINSPIVFARRICVYNKRGAFASVGTVSQNFVNSSNYMIQLTEVDKAYQNPGKRTIIGPHEDPWEYSGSNKVISVSRGITDYYNVNNVLGVAEAQQPFELIQEICSLSGAEGMAAIVLDEEGNLVYPLSLSNKRKQIIEDKTQNDRILQKEDTVFYRYKSDYSGWTTIVTQSKSSMQLPIQNIKYAIMLLAGITVLLIIGVIKVITRRVSRPILEVTDKVRTYDITQECIELAFANDSLEAYHLETAFNNMIHRLQTTMKENVQSKTNELNAQVLALQTQINPHFIFNTLMAISVLAQEKQNDKIVDVCCSLADLLRYSASFKETNVMLRDEIKNIKSYLELWKLRYEDDLTYHVNINKTMEQITVPKFILQPIIENSFIYAFQSVRPPWIINISGKIEEGSWYVQMWDNGTGMKAEQIDEIHKKIDEYMKAENPLQGLEIGGLALVNIWMRLYFLYKEKLIFHMSNTQEPKGFEVIIGGPLDMF